MFFPVLGFNIPLILDLASIAFHLFRMSWASHFLYLFFVWIPYAYYFGYFEFCFHHFPFFSDALNFTISTFFSCALDSSCPRFYRCYFKFFSATFDFATSTVIFFGRQTWIFLKNTINAMFIFKPIIALRHCC